MDSLFRSFSFEFTFIVLIVWICHIRNQEKLQLQKLQLSNGCFSYPRSLCESRQGNIIRLLSHIEQWQVKYEELLITRRIKESKAAQALALEELSLISLWWITIFNWRCLGGGNKQDLTALCCKSALRIVQSSTWVTTNPFFISLDTGRKSRLVNEKFLTLRKNKKGLYYVFGPCTEW